MLGIVLLLGLAAVRAPVLAAPQAAGDTAQAWAPDVLVTTRTSPDSLTVGDRLQLDVIVQAPPGAEVRFPERVEPGAPIEVLGLEVLRPEAARRTAPGDAWIGRYTLAAFRVGDVVLAPWSVEVNHGGHAALAASDSIRIHVQSVLDDSLAAAGMRDLKPQARLAVSPWPWIAAGAALVALAALVLWWWRRRRRRRAAVVPLVRARPAPDVALESLRRLESQHLPIDGKFGEFHVRMSEIVRRYLEDGFGVAALEETTEEILFDLDRHGFERRMLERLATLCLEGDLVKFAKHEPTIEECSRAMERAREFVVGTAARCTPRPGQGTEPVAAAEPAAAVQGGAA